MRAYARSAARGPEQDADRRSRAGSEKLETMRDTLAQLSNS